MKPPFSILIVEDIEAMRKLIRLVLEPELPDFPEFKVSGTVGSGFEARLELDRRRPDLVLLDIILGVESGLDLLPDLAERGIPALVLVAPGGHGGGWSLDPGRIRGGEALKGQLMKPRLETIERDRERIRQELLTLLAPIAK